MEKENTPEAKARFFALYWGQKVARFIIGRGLTSPMTIGCDNQYCALCKDEKYGFGNAFLELEPLSGISGDDSKRLERIVEPVHDIIQIASNGRIIADLISVGASVENHTDAVDFLRSRGYYVGDGTEIEYGWVKLKQK